MPDIFSVLSSSYVSQPPIPRGHYVPVKPKDYEGTWTGKYDNGQKFSFTISDVQGYIAQVKFQTGNGPISSQTVLISDKSFRIGNTKFLLVGSGKAEVGTVVTNPQTGANTLNKGEADRS
jgi:hypothetical protein